VGAVRQVDAISIGRVELRLVVADARRVQHLDRHAVAPARLDLFGIAGEGRLAAHDIEFAARAKHLSGGRIAR
jgi:hypothetical protein